MSCLACSRRYHSSLFLFLFLCTSPLTFEQPSEKNDDGFMRSISREIVDQCVVVLHFLFLALVAVVRLQRSYSLKLLLYPYLYLQLYLHPRPCLYVPPPSLSHCV